jgi:arylesterase/paraoxonase
MTELACCTCLALIPEAVCTGCPRWSLSATTRSILALTSFRMNNLNASGRSLTDQLVVLDARSAGSLASRIWALTPENFPGVNGDGTLNLHGFDIREDSEHKLHILLINHRPPFDSITGRPLDPASFGANSTIELFEAAEGAQTMHHVRTYYHDSIQTPNRVAWTSEGGFVFSNDHSAKVGLVSINILFDL